jgi:chromosome partitioning protein
MQRVIAVLNQKGGVGKTTTVINLSACLAKTGLKILIIDLDSQANATSGLGVDKLQLKKTIYKGLIENLSQNDIILSTAVKNLWLLPSSADLANAEVQMATMPNREKLLGDFLAHHQQPYDLIFIDCPPSLGLLTVNALVAATDVLIPVQTEYYAMEGLSQLLQVIQRVQQRANPSLQMLGVLMTMADSRTTLSRQVHNEIIKAFGNLVFETVIPRNIRLAEAPSYGQPITEYDKWSKGARAYKNLAKEVKQRVGNQ